MFVLFTGFIYVTMMPHTPGHNGTETTLTMGTMGQWGAMGAAQGGGVMR